MLSADDKVAPSSARNGLVIASCRATIDRDWSALNVFRFI
jgi:hypothetical protein